MRVRGYTIRISNPEKVLYPGGHFSKGNVIEYYSKVAPALLPHFRNRPVTLVRFPDGVFGESFFEKNAPGFTPAWIKTFPVERSGGGVIRYILINDKATLLWAANLAALELHPFLHRIPDIHHPSHIVFDLDPGEGADILSCAQVGLMVRDLLAKLNLRAFAKVSGSKGLQVYVPLNRPVVYELVQPFARTVAELLSRRHPDEVVADMSKTLRAGKVFIDWSQNSVSKTTVGVYSLRAKHAQPFVSMPVEWLELKRALRAREPGLLYFSPAAALERIKKHGDLFSPVLRLKQDLPEAFTKSHSVKVPRVSKSLQVYGCR